MKKPVIVFDFDKTLTYHDTLFGYYRAVSDSRLLFRIKYPFYLLFAFLFKLGFISNTTLKEVGVWFYLRGCKHERLIDIGESYSKKIHLNNVYSEVFNRYSPNEILIISASFEEYIKPLFPNHKVIASKLSYNDSNEVTGLLINMYGENKREWLLNSNIKEVNTFYTDSLADKPVIEISEHVIMVDGDKMAEFK